MTLIAATTRQTDIGTRAESPTTAENIKKIAAGLNFLRRDELTPEQQETAKYIELTIRAYVSERGLGKINGNPQLTPHNETGISVSLAAFFPTVDGDGVQKFKVTFVTANSESTSNNVVLLPREGDRDTHPQAIVLSKSKCLHLIAKNSQVITSKDDASFVYSNYYPGLPVNALASEVIKLEGTNLKNDPDQSFGDSEIIRLAVYNEKLTRCHRIFAERSDHMLENAIKSNPEGVRRFIIERLAEHEASIGWFRNRRLAGPLKVTQKIVALSENPSEDLAIAWNRISDIQAAKAHTGMGQFAKNLLLARMLVSLTKDNV